VSALDVAGTVVGGALAGLARLRGGKAVHPHGVSYRARLAIEGTPAAPAASELLSQKADHPALVRFSRSLGLPRPLPDLLGASIRVLDAYGDGQHQDLLLVTSADLPVARHLFLPAGDVQQRPYSSSLPYRAGDRSFVVGLRAAEGSPRPRGGDEFERLERAALTGRLRFELVVASERGRFERVGTLSIGSKLPPSLDALRFNPFNTGGGLELAGVLNGLRGYAYPLSQRAWAKTGGRAAAQREADEEMRTLVR
jgi:hypothetical protein